MVMDDGYSVTQANGRSCRFCGASPVFKFLDLGFSPPSNNYLNSISDLHSEETLPLVVGFCSSCGLAQTLTDDPPEGLFNDNYAYVSGISKTWIDHCKALCSDVEKSIPLRPQAFVIEIASNDGTLIENFQKRGYAVLGVEPTAKTRAMSEEKGIPVIPDFFCADLARVLVANHGHADLVVATNVLAHVPDIADFINGLAIIADPVDGHILIEFPHLMNLMVNNLFDTVYHEHYSYLSLQFVCEAFSQHGLLVYRVDSTSTHGGSYRIHARALSADPSKSSVQYSVTQFLEMERSFGISSISTYDEFQERILSLKLDIVEFVVKEKRNGNVICGVGAAAKANTVLNYCGITKDLISVIGDSSPAKQGKFMPGSHIPIVSIEDLARINPDVIIVFAWNVADELVKKCREIGIDARFYTLSPSISLVG